MKGLGCRAFEFIYFLFLALGDLYITIKDGRLGKGKGMIIIKDLFRIDNYKYFSKGMIHIYDVLVSGS